MHLASFDGSRIAPKAYNNIQSSKMGNVCCESCPTTLSTLRQATFESTDLKNHTQIQQRKAFQQKTSSEKNGQIELVFQIKNPENHSSANNKEQLHPRDSVDSIVGYPSINISKQKLEPYKPSIQISEDSAVDKQHPFFSRKYRCQINKPVVTRASERRYSQANLTEINELRRPSNESTKPPKETYYPFKSVI